MDLITPTEREARLAVKDNDKGLVVLCNQLLSKSNSKNIILKLGGDGVVVHSKIKKNNYFTDEIEALNTNP